MSRSLLLSILISIFVLTLFAFASKEYRLAASRNALTNPFPSAAAAPNKWKQPNSLIVPSSVTVSALPCNRADAPQMADGLVAAGGSDHTADDGDCTQPVQRMILPR